MSEINTKNVGKLKVLCTYDVDRFAAFESGLIMVDNALIGTTEFDIFSLNPATGAENWRTHEDYPPLFCPPTEAPLTWTACCFAAPRAGGCWAMTSRPASGSGQRTDVHFCPGAIGGAEWNSPAYVPPTNLILVGEVEWCDTVKPKDAEQLRSVAIGQPWAERSAADRSHAIWARTAAGQSSRGQV